MPDPTIDEFRALFALMAPKLGFSLNAAAVDDLIQRHFRAARRSFRSCHPRDLLLQVRSLCLYQSRPLELTRELFDEAVENYFAKPELTQSNMD